jgi:hypothetical protein
MDRETRTRQVAFDESKVFDCPLTVAVKYLSELAKTHPKACITHVWTGYEDMHVEIQFYEPETDEELADRLETEKARAERAAEERKRKAAEDERRAQYLKLKREFDRGY